MTAFDATLPAIDSFSVSRAWGTLRTPWLLRRFGLLRRRAAVTSPDTHRYTGQDPDVFAAQLLEQTGRFTQPAGAVAGAREQPVTAAVQTQRAARGDWLDPLDLVPVSGAGTGGGGGFWADMDETVAVIALVGLVLLVLLVAVPLGLIAAEFAIAIAAVAAGVVARLLHLRPWTLLVKRGGHPVAAISVTGWRSSCALLAALRRQLAAR